MEIYQIISIVVITFWIGLVAWAVNDISNRLMDRKKRQQKILWTNLVVLFPFGGMLVYLFFGRKAS